MLKSEIKKFDFISFGELDSFCENSKLTVFFQQHQLLFVFIYSPFHPLFVKQVQHNLNFEP